MIGGTSSRTSRVTTGDVASTLNEFAVLYPVLPPEPSCDAWTVYVPSPSGGDAATDHAPVPASRLVASVSTGVPVNSSCRSWPNPLASSPRT